VERAAVKLSENPLERRLQVSGILLILGLLTESLCLLWARPLSFLALISVGGVLLFAGMAVYLLSLLVIRRPRP
jgi:hypothetical protein